MIKIDPVGFVENKTTCQRTVNMVSNCNVIHVMNMDTKLNFVILARQLAMRMWPYKRM
jgi:hypothetical protein